MKSRICLIIDRPDAAGHPVLAPVLRALSLSHHVALLDLGALAVDDAVARLGELGPADLVLLKARTPRALEVARVFESRGCLVLNGSQATAAALDRAQMAHRLRGARLPCPYTWTFSSLQDLLAQANCSESIAFPLVIKSRYSRRGDLVARLDTIEQLRSLGTSWSEEPVVIQRFIRGDGWDVKLWAIEGEMFVARRPSPLDGPTPGEAAPSTVDERWDHWRAIAVAVGSAFDLRLYGVDLVLAAKGPTVVDVNPFPGFRDVPRAPDALVHLLGMLARTRRALT